MIFKPSTPTAKVKPAHLRKADKAVGKIVKPKKGTSSGRVYNQNETFKEQSKKNSRAKKGYKGNTRV